MPRRPRGMEALRRELASKEAAIRARLTTFRNVGRRPDRELFEELCFCFLAIQTSAHAADNAIRGLSRGGLLWTGDEASVARFLRHRVRFHNHKAAYIVRARQRFFPDDRATLRAELAKYRLPEEARAWLVREVDGLGMKEASHFLRNIGLGEDLAILDRHILRNLVRCGVLGHMPRSLTHRRYLEIEERMASLAKSLGVSLGVLDLSFWSRETGEIFK